MNLLMPMAGRGSRFAEQGIREPKPLIDLGGKPFFWWAVESVRRATPIEEMVFVVLEEHDDQFEITDRIQAFYPEAKIHKIPDITAGSAETAAIGLQQLQTDHPVAINDCDHAFLMGDLKNLTEDAALTTFRSDRPTFSYAQFDTDGRVINTVEKQIVSPFAIAGCYIFRSPTIYLDHYQTYRQTCPYNELFISGIYNEILKSGGQVAHHELQEHFPFGTPEELEANKDRILTRLKGWL